VHILSSRIVFDQVYMPWGQDFTIPYLSAHAKILAFIFYVCGPKACASIAREIGADRIAWYVARRHVCEYHHAGVVRIGFFLV
jgi:hypothetical protein